MPIDVMDLFRAAYSKDSYRNPNVDPNNPDSKMYQDPTFWTRVFRPAIASDIDEANNAANETRRKLAIAKLDPGFNLSSMTNEERIKAGLPFKTATQEAAIADTQTASAADAMDKLAQQSNFRLNALVAQQAAEAAKAGIEGNKNTAIYNTLSGLYGVPAANAAVDLASAKYKLGDFTGRSALQPTTFYNEGLGQRNLGLRLMHEGERLSAEEEAKKSAANIAYKLISEREKDLPLLTGTQKLEDYGKNIAAQYPYGINDTDMSVLKLSPSGLRSEPNQFSAFNDIQPVSLGNELNLIPEKIVQPYRSPLGAQVITSNVRPEEVVPESNKSPLGKYNPRADTWTPRADEEVNSEKASVFNAIGAIEKSTTIPQEAKANMLAQLRKQLQELTIEEQKAAMFRKAYGVY